MRKGVKIKACMILLAWMMIFLHGTVPHNHFEDHWRKDYKELHLTIHHQHNNDLSKSYSSKCEDEAVCSISNSLYHEFSQDNLIFQPGREINLFHPSKAAQIISNNDQKFHSGNFIGSASLRAPPTA